jgi:murein DD-endopeptidase MepM/ murein hydrolase activator NlpD
MEEASVDTGAEIVVTDSAAMYGGQPEVAQISDGEIIVSRGDTLYKIARENNMTVDELAKLNDLTEPYALSVGQKLKLAKAAAQTVPENTDDVLIVGKPVATVQTTTRVALREVTVETGDTLYSLSRRYSVPVNDLAVMNNLSAPFALSVGQKLKVPDLNEAPVAKVVTVKSEVVSPKSESEKPEQVTKKTEQDNKVATVKSAAEPKKISSDPSKKLPKISARSSSQFSWPVRGKILSAYGAKSSGLFNDGINIGASRGTAVKAAENGVVAYAGNEVKGMGNLIIIQHSDGWMTVYAHMDSMVVRRGNKVSVGQKIGTVGETGKVDSPQLHFEVRKGTKAYNPSNYLRK